MLHVAGTGSSALDVLEIARDAGFEPAASVRGVPARP
jgi:hypothetical protein